MSGSAHLQSAEVSCVYRFCGIIAADVQRQTADVEFRSAVSIELQHVTDRHKQTDTGPQHSVAPVKIVLIRYRRCICSAGSM